MPSRRPDDMTRPTMEKWLEFQQEASARLGIDVIITNTGRTMLEQAAYFAQGRMGLEYVNYIRRLAGLPDISEKANRRLITHTLWSMHLFGCAWDYCIVSGGEAHWSLKADVNNDNVSDYKQLCDLAEEFGIETGRAYGDYVHCQVTGGLSLDELKAGKRPT